MADGGTINKVSVGPYEYNIGGEQPHLYMHKVNIETSETSLSLVIYTANNTQFTISSLLTWLNDKGYTTSNYCYPSSNRNGEDSGGVGSGVYRSDSENIGYLSIGTDSGSAYLRNYTCYINDIAYFNDTVTQIF